MIVSQGKSYGTAKHAGDFRIAREYGESVWYLECELWEDQYWRLDDVTPQRDWMDLLPEMWRRQAVVDGRTENKPYLCSACGKPAPRRPSSGIVNHGSYCTISNWIPAYCDEHLPE